MTKLQSESSNLSFCKLNVVDFEDKFAEVSLEQEIMKETSMTAENHLAMVENFVEKYLPIRI